MGFALPLIVPFLLISSSLSNPIPLDRAAVWSPQDEVGILEQSAQHTTQLPASDKLTCDDSGADRCLVFPIGCVSGVNCTDRLEMRRVKSGTRLGDIIISLNLHVSRIPHMLVAIPMPDLSNPNSTFLIGCSIDDQLAVVAKPDVDGVTDQLQMPWLNLVSVRATSSDLECIVSAAPGYVDLPEGDVAVFAGDLEPEEEVRQSARIGGSLEDETEVTRDHGKSRERVEVETSIQKISSPHSLEGTTPPLEKHPEGHEPILVSVEDQRPTPPPLEKHPEGHEPILVSVENHRLSTTEIPKMATVTLSKSKLRLKMLHSSESSSAERDHDSSAETTHSTHAPVHHETTPETTTTSEMPVVEETTVTTTNTTEIPSTPTSEQQHTTNVEESDTSTTTVLPLHHATTHHHDSHEHHTLQPHHSHERASVDKEHQSVRMPPASTTTTTSTEKPASFEDDKELSEEDKQLLRAVKDGLMKEERSNDDEEDETSSGHADGTDDGRKHATMYELTREAAQDPIGRKPNEHSHSHHSSSHSHEQRAAANDDEEEKEKHTKKEVTRDDEDEKKEEEDGSNDGGRQKMGETKHQRRSEETDEEENEEEDDATSSFSLIIPMIVCLAPIMFG